MTDLFRLGGRLVTAVALILAIGCEGSRAEPRVLVFGSPEAATPEMVSALAEAAAEEEVELRMTTDPAAVTEDSLARYRGFILLNSSGDLLDRRQQADLERFVEAGGAFLELGSQPSRTWPWLSEQGEGGENGIVRLASGGEAATYSDPAFRQRLGEAFATLAGGNPRYNGLETARVPDSTRFEQQILIPGPLDEPTEMAIASDGRVFFTERRGALKLFEPTTGEVRVVHEFELFTEDENGLIGITLDPAFDSNGWIYLTRTVGDTIASDLRHRVARFTFDGQGIGDERMLFEVPIDRGCCHTGGSMTFDGEGNLLVSFGDNTNPFATSYAPIDDRPGRELWDARRSSANTDDLRGKIVRITPQDDGTYTIPAGNLFSDTTVGRPEIYTMGHRNPYRISVDAETGMLFWGEVGPDARIDSLAGPIGYDEVNRARGAGNYGWPLFIADNKAYRARDFAADTLGEPFDPANPVNTSRYNTGARELPAAEPAMIYYPYERSEEFPQVGEGGRTAMAGPLYRTTPFADSEVRLPEYYDGKFIFYEWIRGWMMAATLDENGDFVRMEPFLDHLTFDHPMDVEVGPDGSLYVLEYGTLWFAPNPGAQLSRIVYHAENRPPTAVISATPTVGAAPLQVALSAEESLDADEDDRLDYTWVFADGTSATGTTVQRTFAQAGVQPVRLVVTDGDGAADTATVQLQVGNAPPEVQIAVEGNRSFYWGSEPLRYDVSVRDIEDGSLGSGIDPQRVRVTVDYQPRAAIEAAVLGHQTEQTPAGLAYIQEGDCVACHNIDQASAGPSYRAVAERYAGAESADDQLVRKIIEGGSGVWGEQVMPAHPDMSEDVAREIVRYIRSLATPGEPLPPQGTIALDRHSPEEAGAYVLTASYVDQPGSSVAPQETREQLVLRAPTINAVDVLDRWGMAAPTDSTAETGRAVPLSVTADGAYLHLGEIDLTGVGSVVVTVEGVTSNLTFELREGAPDGETLAAGTLNAAAAQGRVEAPLPISASGEHDLYLVVRTGDDTVGPWSPAARLLSLRFERAGA